LIAAEVILIIIAGANGINISTGATGAKTIKIDDGAVVDCDAEDLISFVDTAEELGD